MTKNLLMWLDNLDQDEASIVDKKFVDFVSLAHAGVPFPKGFVITHEAIKLFFTYNKLLQKFTQLTISTDTKKHISTEILRSPFPKELVAQIFEAYTRMGGHLQDIHLTLKVAAPSFSREYHCIGEANLIEKIKEIIEEYVSLQQSIEKIPPISMYIYKSPKNNASGLLFTQDPDKEKAQVKIVSVSPQPLTISLHKNSLYEYSDNSYFLSKKHIHQLVEVAKITEKVLYFPQEMQWILDNNNLYIIDIKPLTTKNDNRFSSIEQPAGTIHTATKIFAIPHASFHASDIAKEYVDGLEFVTFKSLLHEITQHPKVYVEEKGKTKLVDALAEKLISVCESFSPRPVIYTLSQSTTQDYSTLKGGERFEVKEANPFLGLRGAQRHIQDTEMLSIELEAIKKVKNKNQLKNIWLALPFVRSVKELIQLRQLIASHGLFRSATFKLLLVAQIPSNVILLDDFIDEGIDGVIIDPLMLTTLITGIDRKNTDLVHLFNPQDTSVLWAYEKIITTSHKRKITSFYSAEEGIHEALIEKLIAWGVTSISVPSSMLEMTREEIIRIEKKLITKNHG